MIDCARLAAETAYIWNEAVVGALAEALGDEGAAERWLMDFLALLGHGAPDGGDAGAVGGESGDASKASKTVRARLSYINNKRTRIYLFTAFFSLLIHFLSNVSDENHTGVT